MPSKQLHKQDMQLMKASNAAWASALCDDHLTAADSGDAVRQNDKVASRFLRNAAVKSECEDDENHCEGLRLRG